VNSGRGVARNFMPIVGGVVLLCVAGYYGFMAIDTIGLVAQRERAIVTKKSFQAAGTTYITQIINNRPVVLPQVKAEAYLLELRTDRETTDAVVTKELFDAVETSDQVFATFQRTRLTRRLQVLEVGR
jgi:hypothetical protein